jgi:anti-sigma regulatory factor (Ser/Thr protein kinase)
MQNSAIEKTELPVLEEKLRHQTDALKRLLLIDQLAGQYTFTDIKKAQTLLQEQWVVLQNCSYPDFLLNYHINCAFIENQLYNYQTAKTHLEKVQELVEERGDVKQQAEVYIDYAGVCINLQEMDQATTLLEKANRLLKNFPDLRLQARAMCREGFLNLHYNDYPRAIEMFLEAEKIINRLTPPLSLKDSYFLTLIFSGLGKVFERNDDREKSVQSYLKVVEMDEKLGMRTRLSWHYLNVGNGYMALNDQKNAERFYLKAIDTTDDISQEARASAHANLGYGHFENRNYDKALELFDRAELLYKEQSTEDYLNFSIIEAWRGRVFADMEETEKARIHFAQALEYAQLSEDYKQLSSVCKDIATLYAELQDYKSAYEYQLLHDKMSGRYLEEINKRKIFELEVKYEAEKKRQEAELLRLQASKLQLKALRAQMNPHFLYNALNAIQHYITSNDTTAAAKYLAKFAKLMRQSLEYSESEIIPLEKEVEFLDDYLHINERLRFENRLKYQITVDDEIEEDILGVPTMIVQPYVENAIEHGLRTRKEGLIKVDFSLFDEDTILCVVEDNGIGRTKAHQLRISDPKYQDHRSRGTTITEQRLDLLHNSKQKDLLVQTTDLYDPETGEARGTRVEIKIPILETQIK